MRQAGLEPKCRTQETLNSKSSFNAEVLYAKYKNKAGLAPGMQKLRETADQGSTQYDGGNNKEYKQTEGLNTQEETGAEWRCLGETHS